VLAQTEASVRKRVGGASLVKLLDSLSAAPAGADLPADELRRLRLLAQAAAEHPLSNADAREFAERLTRLLQQARRDYAAARKKLKQHRQDLTLRRLP
jgi:hypothetical protein